MSIRVNACDPRYADELIYVMAGKYIDIFGDINDEAYKAIELRVKDGCAYPVSDTPGDVLEVLEMMGWPI